MSAFERSRGGSVLVIDDEDIVRGVFVRFLREIGYTVHEATDGREGLAVFDRERPDVVLSDLRMPRMDGMKVLAALRQSAPDTPVVMVSGTDDVREVIGTINAGAWDYLLKPIIDMSVLEHSVRRAVDHVRLLEENRAHRERLEEEVRRRTEELTRTIEQLNHAQRMESVGRLAGGVAHDFNNLLSPILAYSELLLLDMPPKDKRRDEILQIQAAAERAKELTRQLLAFSRKQVLEMKMISLGQVVLGFERILRRTIREDIALAVEVLPSRAGIMADVSQVEQILMNLAVNAQDAITGQGRITITVEDVILDSEWSACEPAPDPGGYVMLTFADDGCGMEESVIPSIFEPFFTTKERGKGTGLGLATVHGIVMQHGGRISVTSSPRNGAVFRICFPTVGEALDSYPAPDPMEQSLLGRETVFVVEDDDVVCALVRTILEKHGYHVPYAGGPAGAVAAAEEARDGVDLLLTDVVMPRIGGAEIHARLKRRWPALKVLFMSGYSADILAAQGALPEGARLLGKPISVRTLTTTVREILDG